MTVIHSQFISAEFENEQNNSCANLISADATVTAAEWQSLMARPVSHPDGARGARVIIVAINAIAALQLACENYNC